MSVQFTDVNARHSGDQWWWCWYEADWFPEMGSIHGIRMVWDWKGSWGLRLGRLAEFWYNNTPLIAPPLTGLAATVAAGLSVRVTGCLAVARGGVHMISEIRSQWQEACGIAWNSMRLVRRCCTETQREPDNLVVNISNLTWLAQMHIYVQRALLATLFILFRYVLCFLLHVKTVHLYFKIFNHIPQTLCMLQIQWPRRWRTYITELFAILNEAWQISIFKYFRWTVMGKWRFKKVGSVNKTEEVRRGGIFAAGDI